MACAPSGLTAGPKVSDRLRNDLAFVYYRVPISSPARTLSQSSTWVYRGVGEKRHPTTRRITEMGPIESMFAIFTGTPSVDACTARVPSTAIATCD